MQGLVIFCVRCLSWFLHIFGAHCLIASIIVTITTKTTVTTTAAASPTKTY